MYNIDKVVKIQVEIDRILNYESYKVRLEDDGTDIVLIAIPSDIHKALSVQSMCHQKDVILKLVTLMREELIEIIAVEIKPVQTFMAL